MVFLGIDLAWWRASETRRANESGVIALSEGGQVLDAGWTRDISETLAWIESSAETDTLLFVDAPLVVTNETGQRIADRQVGQRYGRWKVSANSINLRSKGLVGVELREQLEARGWRYDDGLSGPPEGGRTLSECYPYTTIVGVPRLGYRRARPRYKRKPKGMRIADFRPERAQAADDLIARLAGLRHVDPPLDLASHPVTRQLLDEPSPLHEREYKHREDLIDAAICAWTAALWHRHGFEQCQVLGPDSPAGGEPLAPTMVAPARPDQRRPMGRFLEIEMPPIFVLEAQDKDGAWLDHALLYAEDFSRQEDGTYLCATEGSPVWLRCLEQRGNEINVVDGGGERFTYRLVPFPSGKYRPSEGRDYRGLLHGSP